MNSLDVQTGSINQLNLNEIYRNAVNRFGNVYLGGNYDDIHLDNEYSNKVIGANNAI